MNYKNILVLLTMFVACRCSVFGDWDIPGGEYKALSDCEGFEESGLVTVKVDNPHGHIDTIHFDDGTLFGLPTTEATPTNRDSIDHMNLVDSAKDDRTCTAHITQDQEKFIFLCDDGNNKLACTIMFSRS